MEPRGEDDQKAAKEDASDSPELRDAVLSGCLAACFQTLLAASGPEETIQAMGLYSRLSGMALACNARERFGLEGNGFEDAGIPLLWGWTAISNRQAAMEVYEHGVVISCTDCPAKIAAPELCVANSHNVAQGICETINPDLVPIFTDHLTDGGSSCRCVMTKASRLSINALGNLVKVVRLSELPEEEVRALRAHFISEILNTTMRTFVDLHGSEKTLEMTKPPAHVAGLSLGKRLISEFGFEKRDYGEAEGCIRMLCNAMGQEGTIYESANGQLMGEEVDCPLKSSPPEVCEVLETFRGGAVMSFDPDSELVFDRMMSKGDKTCHWLIKKKGNPAKEKRNEEIPSDDPARILALRFAKGEISLEEFDRSMILLRKHNVIN